MKKLVGPIIIILGVVLAFWYLKDNTEVATNAEIKTYRNSNLGISFSYPKILTASSTAESVVIHHDIPYQNHGDCDMIGDEKTYDRLTDFKVTIFTKKQNLIDTMKLLSPYIPQENFVNGEVVEAPGFIDVYKIGKLSGFAIYEGAEGCGQTTYYFPIENNKTLVVQKASIQILSGVVSEELRNSVLAIPEAISLNRSEEIFTEILKSLEVK